MYYRRKVLLALIETFGGTLKRTDCQKLLFLFCQYTHKNHYDFFPYKFGSFSYMVCQDKDRLTDLQLLKNSNYFELLNHGTFFSQLNSAEQSVLLSMKSRFYGLRGKELIRKIYLDYPQFTCRSRILSNIMNPEEIKQIKREWKTDHTPTLFTIGYEGLSIDAYLNRLISNNVKALIDVRKNPLSMKYGFSKSKLKYYVENAGLKYFHIPELGIPTEMRKSLKEPDDYQLLFQYYKTEILPRQTCAMERLKSLHDQYSRTALTCYEADYQSCHRHKIAECLRDDAAFSATIVHL
jgi:hypothetical protein